MRHFRTLFLLLALAGLASAQTTLRLGGTGSGGVTFTSTAQQDALTPIARDQDNAQLCLFKGLPKTCTQAQVNAMPGCAGGACGTIYTSDFAGSAQYALDHMTGCYFSTLSTKITAQQATDAAIQASANGGSIATNLVCANAGLSNGCTKFAAACMVLNGTADCK